MPVNANPSEPAENANESNKRAEGVQVFKVTGVVKDDGRDEQILIEALSEANARVKAELRGIIVTSIETVETSPPQRAHDNPQDSASSATPSGSQPSTRNSSATEIERKSGQWRNKLATAFLVLGWLLFVLGLLSGLSSWIDPGHRRDAAIEAMLEGDSWAIGSALAFLIGFSIPSVTSMLFGFGAYALSKRERGGGLVVAALICVLITIGGQLKPSKRNSGKIGTSSADTIRKTGEELSRIYESAAPPAGQLPQPPVKSQVSTGAREADFMVELSRQFVAGIMEDANEYARTVISLRIDSVLLPVRLDSAAKIKDSKADLDAAQKAQAKYEAAFWERVSQAQESIRGAPLPANTRSTMLTSYNKGLSNSISHAETVFYCEREMYLELNALLDLLAAKQGKFNFKNGQLIFDDDADVVEYNTSFNRYTAIAAKQATMRQRGQENVQAYGQKLGSAQKPGDFTPPKFQENKALTRDWALELSESGFVLNKTKINLPTTVDTLAPLLGKPSRVLAKVNTIHVWDERGIFTYSKPGSTIIDSIAICLNPNDGLDYYPTNQFFGSLTLGNVKVSEIDTPHSLNRKLPNEKFERLDPWVRVWNLRLPPIVVGMGIEKSGLTDWMTIRAARAEDGALTRQGQDIFDKIAEELKTPRFSGTGFFVTDSGHILTSLHVVKNSTKVVVLHAGRRVPATKVGSDEPHDLALLKADIASAPLAVGSSASVRLGQGVFTVGFPNIEVQGKDPKLTRGEISSLRGLLDEPNSFQVSVPVQPGNSGGPLMVLDGTVVGLLQMRLEPVETFLISGSMPQNVNYAVKSDLIRKFLESTPATKGKLKNAATGDSRRFEAVVEKVTESTVLVLAY